MRFGSREKIKQEERGKEKGATYYIEIRNGREKKEGKVKQLNGRLSQFEAWRVTESVWRRAGPRRFDRLHSLILFYYFTILLFYSFFYSLIR